MKAVPFLLLAISVGVLAARPAGSGQDVLRLQQELSTLKFRFDYETNRLEQRLEAIERQARQAELRPDRGPVLAPAPRPSLPAAAVGDDVTVRRLVVTDAAGNARAVLAVSEIYGPMLGLLNVHGDVVALLSAPEDGPRLELFDGAATRRVLLGLEDGAELSLFGEAGTLDLRLPAESAEQ